MDNVCGYKIKVIHQSYDEFLAQLTQADLILTPTRRLATRLNKDCAQWMAKKNKNVWHIDIVSITGWFDRLWQDYQDDNDNPPMQRLNAWQNQLIWQEIINAEPSPLLRKDAAAQMAEQAWILLKEWCIPWQSLVNENVSTDIQTFIDWCQQYQEACSKKNVLDSASVLEYLNPKLSHKIYLIGFTDIKPAVQRIFTLLCEQGSSIEILEYREKALVYCAAQLNAHTELEQAALWAKSKLAQNPNEPIGVIIPDLALRFNEVDRVFAKTLMPQTILANHYHSQKPYNISSGNRLSDYPVISIVFELFKYNLRKMPVDHLSKILLSPFITGGVSEHLNRSQIDLEIKKRGQEYVAPPTIVSIPPLNDSLLKPSLWVELFKIYLNAWGWPGERVLNSLEYQLVKRFYELLNDFASLDCIQKPLSYTAAHHLLFQQAQKLLFQGESENAPLQILGALEGEGLYFQALWVMGLHHENWPQACSPHPFIPIELQRQHFMPHASSEREYIFASHLTQRFTQQAKQVILSYPQQENDKHLMPSRLIRDYPAYHSTVIVQMPALYDQELILESWFESPIPLNKNNYIAGGVGLLQSQSACPFQAFARYRLKAKSPDPRQSGLSFAQRGELVHAALEFFWKKIKTSKALSILSSAELEAGIHQAINYAIKQIPAHTVSAMHLVLETNRLQALLKQWLDFELKRPAFTVLETEKSIEISLSTIKLKTRIDRIDQLATGEIVLIDYKTGIINQPDWLDTRPLSLQLPLYAMSHMPTQGIAFAMVKANEHKFIDLMAHQTPNQLNLSWPEVLAHWHQVLTTLADEFYQGVATVTPQEAQTTCRYCNLDILCRVRNN